MADARKYKLLIVDDDTFLLNMYSMKFVQAGFDVTTVLSAGAMFEKLNGGGKYDAMVLDLMMPDMDGFQLLEKMKTENLAQSTVKIVLSNLGSETDVKRCSEIGVDGYIIKANSTPDEVVEQVAASLFEKTNS